MGCNTFRVATSRRQMLFESAGGIGGLALAYLLGQEGLLAPARAAAPMHMPKSDRKFDVRPRPPHHEPSAKTLISLFMHGGPSHMDLFDPKPELTKYDGKHYEDNVTFSFINRATKKLMASPYTFRKHGQCGTELSELLPHTAGIVDDIAVIRSMTTGFNDHGASLRMMHTGQNRPGRPCYGSWLTYGLGSENQSLPAYCVTNWSQGWLPTTYQGTPIRPKTPRILNLDVPPELAGPLQGHSLALLERMNQRHLDAHPGEGELEARIANYEMAARMQSEAKEALDLSRESEATKRMYGLDNPVTRSYGERCLIARRLVERGVRFVQIFISSQIWDHHDRIFMKLKDCCAQTDQPSAALVKDLKQRGLLDSTLVTWGGEFGRLPVTENHGDPKTRGRDHNGQGFSTWIAGGGVKGGQAYGETDEVGHRAAVNPVGPADFHATLLHLLGVDHHALTYFQNGREERLTDTEGCRVVKELLAKPPADSISRAANADAGVFTNPLACARGSEKMLSA
jgi:uncharacterized protein (DUF1501 family)